MSCCQNQRVLRTSTGTGTQNKLVLLVLQKKSNPRKPQNVDKYGFLPLRLKNQRRCFWSTLRAKTWHVAQLGHNKWEKVAFQAVFHLSVIVEHPSVHLKQYFHLQFSFWWDCDGGTILINERTHCINLVLRLPDHPMYRLS